MVVEQTVGRTDYSFAIACRIPGQTEARSVIFVIAGNSLDDTESFFSSRVDRSCRCTGRTDFHVVAQAIVQSEFSVYPQPVLEKDAERLVVERMIRITDAL